jgi:hypothetical protein
MDMILIPTKSNARAQRCTHHQISQQSSGHNKADGSCMHDREANNTLPLTSNSNYSLVQMVTRRTRWYHGHRWLPENFSQFHTNISLQMRIM